MFRSKFYTKDKVYALGCAHLQHKNITKGVSSWPNKDLCREFATTEDMTEAVMSGLRNIPEDSHLFLLGDFLFGDKKKVNEYLEQIPSDNIYYIYGNHCLWYREVPKHKKIKWCGDYLEIFYNSNLVVFTHYPFAVWNECHHGSWNVCSHSHGSYPPSRPEYLTGGKILDVGWEVFKRPMPFTEVEKIMAQKKNTPLDHHNEETSK